MLGPWLQIDFVLGHFSKQRKTAIRKCTEFVREGLKNTPIWSELKSQVYLGDDAFVDRVQKMLAQKHDDVQIPRGQKRPVAKSLSDYENSSRTRNEAIVNAYASGAYSYQQLGVYFGLHFTRIGKIVRSCKGNA
jgi:putative transposase